MVNDECGGGATDTRRSVPVRRRSGIGAGSRLPAPCPRGVGRSARCDLRRYFEEKRASLLKWEERLRKITTA